MARSGEDRPAGARAEVRQLVRDALRAVPGGRMPVSGATRSMAPFLRGGDEIVWRRAEGVPRVGDVVLFFRDAPARPDASLADRLRDGGLTVHRVIARRRDGRLVTKGDGLPGADARPPARSDLLGLVVAVVRRGRRYALDGAGARLYARVAAGVSRCGALLFGAATRVDAVAARVVPALGGRWLLRRPAWWLQRAVQGGWYLAGFRALHPRGEEAVPPPPRSASEDIPGER